MNERFRFNCTHILVLSLLFHSCAPHCRPEFLKDTSSSNDEEQSYSLDPIEQIFRAPSEKRNSVPSKRNLEPTSQLLFDSKGTSQVRVKRDNKRSIPKASKDSSKLQEKRSAAPKSSKSSLRPGRSSRDLPKVKQSTDYEASVDQDRSEYLDEAEEEPAKSRETGYKAGEFHVGEDSDRFIDQEERSSLYDDFEAKDVVKRGISGAEDYEEVDEEAAGAVEDVAALDEETLDEQGDRKKVHGDSRVKREHESSKDVRAKETAKDSEASLKREDKDTRAAEDQPTKDSGDIAEQSKRNVAEKSEAESKVNSDQRIENSKPSNDQLEVNENTKEEGPAIALDRKAEEDAKEEGPAIAVDRKAAEDVSLAADKKTPGESSNLEGVKIDEPKIAEVSSPEANKEAPVNAPETPVVEDTVKLDNPRTLEDGDYERHVEEQIQRKIDSIKEEIKREIAENQKIKDIEANNAKFDELHDQEDDEEQTLELEAPGNQGTLAKRSVKDSGKAQARDDAGKRSVKRKKRQDEGGREKIRGASQMESGKESKKRSSKPEDVAFSSEKRREYPRQVYLVRRDRGGGKKRRRRSKSSVSEGTVKMEDGSPADNALDFNLRADLSDSRFASSSKVSEDEKAIAEQSLLDRKSGSVASLTGSGEELGPLATEYEDAFGGLHGEPGVALARFKRIKRVLRPASSKT